MWGWGVFTHHPSGKPPPSTPVTCRAEGGREGGRGSHDHIPSPLLGLSSTACGERQQRPPHWAALWPLMRAAAVIHCAQSALATFHRKESQLTRSKVNQSDEFSLPHSPLPHPCSHALKDLDCGLLGGAGMPLFCANEWQGEPGTGPDSREGPSSGCPT